MWESEIEREKQPATESRFFVCWSGYVAFSFICLSILSRIFPLPLSDYKYYPSLCFSFRVTTSSSFPPFPKHYPSLLLFVSFLFLFAFARSTQRGDGVRHHAFTALPHFLIFLSVCVCVCLYVCLPSYTPSSVLSFLRLLYTFLLSYTKLLLFWRRFMQVLRTFSLSPAYKKKGGKDGNRKKIWKKYVTYSFSWWDTRLFSTAFLGFCTV